MALDQRDVNQLACFMGWFFEEHGRPASSFKELADYLNDERDAGQFANHPAVRHVYDLAMDKNTEQMFSEFVAAMKAKGKEERKQRTATTTRMPPLDIMTDEQRDALHQMRALDDAELYVALRKYLRGNGTLRQKQRRAERVQVLLAVVQDDLEEDIPF